MVHSTFVPLCSCWEAGAGGAGWRTCACHDVFHLHFALYRATKRVTGVTSPLSHPRPRRASARREAKQAELGAGTPKSRIQSSRFKVAVCFPSFASFFLPFGCIAANPEGTTEIAHHCNGLSLPTSLHRPQQSYLWMRGRTLSGATGQFETPTASVIPARGKAAEAAAPGSSPINHSER